jgi:LysR family glycine cleavage system transcriptional activator
LIRLPSFSNLIAFDAVARHGTVTRAAQELNVTQPAVSRRIAALEGDLGRPLFDRRTKPLTLTADGRELFEVLRTGLRHLEAAIARIRGAKESNAVTISAGSGLAAYWLIPRLPEMQAAFPNLVLRISSQTHNNEDDVTGDVQIRFGDGSWGGTVATKMFGEEVFPVCSPLHLERRRVPFSLDQLKKSRLLDMKVKSQPWYDWQAWFEALSSPPRSTLRVLYFDSYPLVVSAALAGQGVCLCWAGLLDAFLSSGALVRLSDRSVASARGYFITHDVNLARDVPARAIVQWLLYHGTPGTRHPMSVRQVHPTRSR